MYIFKAAVVGAGAMGAEIAQVISFSGIPVLLKDVDQQALDRGMATVRNVYQRRVERGRMSQAEMDNRMALVTPVLTYDGFGDVDLVIEAVPEKMELKKRVFAELGNVCQPTAILASNTSALSIKEMALATNRPHRVVGLHFFFPAHVMKLVEVITSGLTDDETMDTAVEFVEGLRKIPVRMRECPGFLVNRVLMAAMGEALHFYAETKTPVTEIDAVIQARGGVPMGPFSLADTLGLDIVLDVAKTLEAAYGERFAPTPELFDLVAAGKIGAKSGSGFYEYTGGAASGKTA